MANVLAYRSTGSTLNPKLSGTVLPSTDWFLGTNNLKVVHLWRDKWTALSGPLCEST